VCSVSFIVFVVLCAVFRLIVVLFCVVCVICLLCLIVLPVPPGKNPFAVKINNNNKYIRPSRGRCIATTVHATICSYFWKDEQTS
jgi:hypothetical protein